MHCEIKFHQSKYKYKKGIPLAVNASKVKISEIKVITVLVKDSLEPFDENEE